MKKRLKHLLCLVMAFTVFMESGVCAYADQISDLKKKNQQDQDKLDEIGDQIDELAGEQQGIKGEMDSLQAEIADIMAVPVESAEDMFQAVTSRMAEQDIIIKAAAVADYTPATVADNKIKKTDGEAAIALTRTKDILGYLGEHRTEKQILCGFSMETENMLENSRKKLDKKHLDLVVANNLKVEGAGFGVDTNVVTLITREGARELPKMTKEEVAGAILDEIVE